MKLTYHVGLTVLLLTLIYNSYFVIGKRGGNGGHRGGSSFGGRRYSGGSVRSFGSGHGHRGHSFGVGNTGRSFGNRAAEHIRVRSPFQVTQRPGYIGRNGIQYFNRAPSRNFVNSHHPINNNRVLISNVNQQVTRPVYRHRNFQSSSLSYRNRFDTNNYDVGLYNNINLYGLHNYYPYYGHNNYYGVGESYNSFYEYPYVGNPPLYNSYSSNNYYGNPYYPNGEAEAPVVNIYVLSNSTDTANSNPTLTSEDNGQDYISEIETNEISS